MLSNSVFELVQQFYHATETVNVASAVSHRRTGRHFTGGSEKICPETNNLP